MGSVVSISKIFKFIAKKMDLGYELPFSAYYLSTIVGSLIFIYLVYLYYRLPNRVRDLSDVGFWHLKDSDRRGMHLKDLANEAVKSKQYGELPPVYPNGWFKVAETRDLNPGDVRPLSLLGLNLVLFRGEDGIARILDAYCPHLGANLGVGSKVYGSCIQCPFHGWRFRGEDGKCISIPYTEKIPEVAKIKSWNTRELNGAIHVWFHAENAEPYWEPLEVKEITTGQFVYRGRSEHYINAHIQELPENGADVAHLKVLHKPNMMYGSDLRKCYGHIWDFAAHIFDASWRPLEEPNAHIANMKLEHSLKLFGKINLMTMSVNVLQVGPGIVHLEFNTLLGRAMLFQNVTPIEPTLQKVTHSLYCDPTWPHLISKIVLFGESIMVERDMVIWNNKTFRNKPLLVKEDQFILKMRRWYSQFYSENSPKFRFRKDSLEW